MDRLSSVITKDSLTGSMSTSSKASTRQVVIDEKLFHEIAEEVEEELMCSGLTGGLYENFAREILVRYCKALADAVTKP